MINELSFLDDVLGTALGYDCSYNGNPDVDVIQNDDSYTLCMDLPGLTEKDIDISLDDGKLTIKSVKTVKEEKKDAKEETKTTYLLRERRSYSFSRTFSLPRDIAQDGISASFVNGVLTVTMKRCEEAKPRTIRINAA